MDPDNAFNEIFGKKPSAEQNTEPKNSQEDASSIKEQSEAVPQAVSGQQPMQEKREPDTAEKSVRKRGRRRKADDCTLTTINLPNTVTAISDWTFYGCSSLTSITIPSSITYIGSGAFYGCRGLTSITIPNNVTFISNSAFYSCI